MVLKRFSQALLAALPLVLLLAACGTDSEPTAEPVSKPPATSEPVPTPKPTATPVPEPKEPSMKQYNSPPAMTIDPNKSYTATLELEKGGEIVIELFAKEAPVTVNNFIFLARDGYYDQVTFHRVIADFMAQSGDPTGTGSGGPGYTIQDEFSPLTAPQRARGAVHGERRTAEHRRRAVVHHARAHATPGRRAHGVR